MGTDNDFDPVVAAAFAQIAPPANGAGASSRAERAQRPRCPPLPALERIARGGGGLKQWLHTNTCARCRKSLAMLRDLGVKSRWDELGAALRHGVCAHEVIIAGTPSAGRPVKAEVWLPNNMFQPAYLSLRGSSFDREGQLWLIVQLERRVEQLGNGPTELIVLAGDDRQRFDDRPTFGPYLLPRLAKGRKEELLILFPPAWQADWQERLTRTETMPFRFILRPCDVTEMDETENDELSSCMTVTTEVSRAGLRAWVLGLLARRVGDWLAPGLEVRRPCDVNEPSAGGA